MKLRTHSVQPHAAVGFCTGRRRFERRSSSSSTTWWPPERQKGKASEFFKEARRRAGTGQGEGGSLLELALYKDKEELEALQLGAVQMLAPSLAKFGPLG